MTQGYVQGGACVGRDGPPGSYGGHKFSLETRAAAA